MSSSVESRPEVPEGYLGQQPKFAEFKLECISHTNAEFTIPNDNEVEIKIRTAGPIKSTANLIQVSDRPCGLSRTSSAEWTLLFCANSIAFTGVLVEYVKRFCWRWHWWQGNSQIKQTVFVFFRFAQRRNSPNTSSRRHRATSSVSSSHSPSTAGTSSRSSLCRPLMRASPCQTSLTTWSRSRGRWRPCIHSPSSTPPGEMAATCTLLSSSTLPRDSTRSTSRCGS